MRLLLNSHIPAAVAEQLRRRGVDAVALAEWKAGDYRKESDDLILSAAASERRVFVTYDCRTVPPLLKVLAETGQHHRGVILVDEETLRSDDIGGLIRALQRVISELASDDWEDQVLYLAK